MRDFTSELPWEADMGSGADLGAGLGGMIMRDFITELPWEAAMGSDADLGAGLGGLGAGHGIGVNRGRGVSIMASVVGGCTEEENGERWLDNMVSSFRIMRSSFKSMEAWVAAKRRVQNPWTLGLWRGWPWRC